MNTFTNLSQDLFKPLASSNATLYKLSLESLHVRLITSHEFEDECTPSEAKQTIRIGLLNNAQAEQWKEDEYDIEAVLETDLATRIYNRLRDTGWIIEIDDIGYRRICSFSQNGGKLLTALLRLGDETSFDIGSVCQGVYTNLQAIHNKPKDNSAILRFCAAAADNFYREVTTLSSTTREIAYLILNETDNRNRMATFFNNFMKDVFEQDYSALHSKDNPYRYRNEIIMQVTDISISKHRLEALADGILSQFPDLTRDVVLVKIHEDLETIRTVFTNIHKLIDGMEKYRRTMTRRMNEAVRYSYRATADIGNRIGELVGKIAQGTGNVLYPAYLVDDGYLSPDRLYEPRRKPDIAQETPIELSPPPIEQIAIDRALDAYLRRRSINVKRLKEYINDAMGPRIKITTDDLPINGLDDLLSFIELRGLINYTSHKDCPYYQFLTAYRVDLIPHEKTINPYITAPKLTISRKETV